MEKERENLVASFAKVNESMIATNDSAWSKSDYFRSYITRVRDYSPTEIKSIIESGSLEKQQELSRNYFFKDGIYKKLIMYYATLLDYSGLLIPNPSFGKSLSSPFIQKRYYNAINFLDSVPLKTLFTNFSQRALVDGSYYGVIQNIEKDKLSILDLPPAFCSTNFKDEYGNDLIEFNITYFDKIFDSNKKKQALKAYPKFISSAYEKYNKGKTTIKWVTIPSDIGICFPVFDGRPLFLSAISACVEYDNAVGIEQERALDEIRKIIVQKAPHLNDGTLLFEPEEVAVMHDGAVGMLKGNQNLSVLTTYADVDAIVSKTGADSNNNILDRMYKNIYNNAGVSPELFCSTGSATLEASIKMDISLMMTFANKYAYFITQVVNDSYANSNINFKYVIFPICEQNRTDYIDETFKLAQSGYSALLPALALGFSQRDILNIKSLENDVLKISDVFIPLSSAYTQSGNSSNDEGGAPTKKESEKQEKTIKNDNSANNTGGVR